MMVLKEYRDLIKNEQISYYWNKNRNLLNGISPITMSNISNRLNAVIAAIEKNTAEPNTVAKFLRKYRKYWHIY